MTDANVKITRPEYVPLDVDPWEVLDLLDAKIYIKNVHGQFIYMNRHCAEDMNLADRTTAYGLTDDAFFTPDNAALYRAAEKRLIETGTPDLDVREFETWKDEDRRTWVLTSKYAVRDITGRIVGLVGISKDITDIQNQEDIYRHFLDNIPALVWVKNEQLRFTYVNQALADAIGKPKEDIIQKTDAELNAFREEVEHFSRDDNEVLRTGSPLHIEEESLTDAKGNVLKLETYKVRLPGPNAPPNLPLQVLGIATNITDRLDAERARSEEWNAKSIRHCLNGWIAVMEGACFALKREVGNSRTMEQLEQAIVFVKRATQLATSMFKLKKAGEFHRIAVNEIVRSVLDPMPDRRIRFSPSNQNTHILGSRFHVENAILELVANARDFAPSEKDGGLIEVWIESGTEICSIHVRDNGDGILNSLQDRIFELFTTSSEGRSGIGLNYVFQIAKAHQGSIRLLKESKGAHFALSFPCLGVLL